MDNNRISELCAQFEAAWNASERPDISAFLSRNGGADSKSVRPLLVELIKIDLDHRWRMAEAADRGEQATMAWDGIAPTTDDDSLPLRPRVEDYVAAFPTLTEEGQLPLDLIAEEFRIRSRWGDSLQQNEDTRKYHALRIRCPQCREAIELLDDKPLTDVVCSACGSKFGVVGD